MNPLSAVYAAAARARRSWYAQHPASRRRLRHPVISVGNLVVGGSGKTPIVAALATLLRDAGERPVVLSRGYARRDAGAATLIVSDGRRVLEPVERSGDEPQLLARTLADVPIVIGANRYAAGCLAENRFDATVVLLDDGFQHFQLERHVDLLVVNERDVAEQVLPFGRLREPLDVAGAADALLVTGDVRSVGPLCRALGVAQAFSVRVQYESARPIARQGTRVPPVDGVRVAAVAGIARPERFFAGLRAQGYDVAREFVFRDHHWFTAADVERVQRGARDAGAVWIVTTEKDAVRLPAAAADSWLRLPMRVAIEPPAAFAAWLTARLDAAREAWGRESLRESK